MSSATMRQSTRAKQEEQCAVGSAAGVLHEWGGGCCRVFERGGTVPGVRGLCKLNSSWPVHSTIQQGCFGKVF